MYFIWLQPYEPSHLVSTHSEPAVDQAIGTAADFEQVSMISIVRLLVATLHVGMTGKQDGGYTQLT